MTLFEENLNELLITTFRLILDYEEQSLRSISDVPVTISEAHMIEAIHKHPDGTNVSAIAPQLGIAVPTATVAIKKLEGKGFVTKLPCTEDGRRLIIRLTPKGTRIARAHQIFHHHMVRNISGHFSEDEKDVLLSMLQKLNIFFAKRVES